MTEDDDELRKMLKQITGGFGFDKQPAKKRGRKPNPATAKSSEIISVAGGKLRFFSADQKPVEPVEKQPIKTDEPLPVQPNPAVQLDQQALINLVKNRLDEHNQTSIKRGNTQPASAIAKTYIAEVGAKISADIIYDLDRVYDKVGLKTLVPYARAVVRKHRATLDSLALNLPYDLLMATESGPSNKGLLVWALAFVFADPNIYRLFAEEMPTTLQQAAEQLTWVPSIGAEALGKLIDSPLTMSTKQQHYYGAMTELAPTFTLLPHRGGGWHGPVTLYWPAAIRSFLQTVYKQPIDFQFHSVEHLPDGLTLWDDGEQVIFEELQKLMAYRIQDSITINASGKVSALVPKKMRKLLALREFFPDDSPFPTIRTAALAQAMVSLPTKDVQGVLLDPLEVLTKLRKAFGERFRLLFLLNDLKEHAKVEMYSSYKQDAETGLIDLVKGLPVGEWVSVSNILNYAQYRDLIKMPCWSNGYAALQYDGPSPYRHGGIERQLVTADKAFVFVEKPGLLSGFFLFAALGWLDIAYETPAGILGKDYFSAYDGLRYVRLNALGASLFGNTVEPYTPKIATTTQALRFDDQSLLIFCDPDNKVAETVLANYAERVSPTRFRVTADTFLTDCKTKAQLKTKINLFSKSVAPDLPSNWTTFFAELLAKAEPFTTVSNLTIFAIPADNQALIRLLAQDSVLKSLVIKAEGYRILVDTGQVAAVKKRLRELGYLL